METTEFGENVSLNPESGNAKKGYGGRPKLSADDRKDSRVPIWGTASELKRLKEVHRLQTFTRKISLSEFVISLILSLEEPETVSTDKINEQGISSDVSSTGADVLIKYILVNDPVLSAIRIDLRDIANSLSRLTSNYNQVVKRINSLPVSKKLKEEVKQNSEVINQMPPIYEKIYELLDSIQIRLKKGAKRKPRKSTPKLKPQAS